MDRSHSDTSLSASVQATQTQSRLPPNTVARKAPRKATIIPAPAMQGSAKVAKPKPRETKNPRLTKTPKQTLRSLAVARKAAKEATPPPEAFGQSTSLPTGLRNAPTQETKKRKAAGAAPLALDANVKRVDKISTMSDSLSLDSYKEIRKELEPQATRSQAPKQPKNPVRPQRPQSRFEYSLIPQLESIKRAFGPDNWTEYIILVEKHELGEITDREFEVQEWRIFRVPSVGVRNKIQKLVLKQMMELKVEE